MPIFEICWKAFGCAEVEADTLEQAEQYVIDGCFNFDDIDFERNQVDGVDVSPA